MQVVGCRYRSGQFSRLAQPNTFACNFHKYAHTYPQSCINMHTLCEYSRVRVYARIAPDLRRPRLSRVPAIGEFNINAQCRMLKAQSSCDRTPVCDADVDTRCIRMGRRGGGPMQATNCNKLLWAAATMAGPEEEISCGIYGMFDRLARRCESFSGLLVIRFYMRAESLMCNIFLWQWGVSVFMCVCVGGA